MPMLNVVEPCDGEKRPSVLPLNFAVTLYVPGSSVRPESARFSTRLDTPDTLERVIPALPSGCCGTHLKAFWPLRVYVIVPEDGPRGCAALVLATIAVKVTGDIKFSRVMMGRLVCTRVRVGTKVVEPRGWARLEIGVVIAIRHPKTKKWSLAMCLTPIVPLIQSEGCWQGSEL